MVEEQTEITWTGKRIAIAALAAQGKTFTQIIAEGYSKDMTSRVLNALKAGQNPPVGDVVIAVVEPGQASKEKEGKETEEKEGEEREGEEKEGKQGEPLSPAGKPLVAVTVPKVAPIIFRFEQKQILLDPIELHRQYSYYTDLASRDGGIANSFSQVLTLAMQTLWVLHQNIPLSENMLRAIFYGGK